MEGAAVHDQAGVISHQVPAHVGHVDAEGGLLVGVVIVQAGGLGEFEMAVRIRGAAAVLDDRIVGRAIIIGIVIGIIVIAEAVLVVLIGWIVIRGGRLHEPVHLGIADIPTGIVGRLQAEFDRVADHRRGGCDSGSHLEFGFDIIRHPEGHTADAGVIPGDLAYGNVVIAHLGVCADRETPGK